MEIARLSPQAAQARIAQGGTLIDIREPDEYAREHIPGAINLPLARLGQVPQPPGQLIFHCRSGMRTEANAARLQAAGGDQPCGIILGGLEAWRAAGLPTRRGAGQPLEIMRQVQLAAGGLVLLGVVLGFAVTPAFFALAGCVGAGLMLAGATGWCGMAKLLRRLPWNHSLAG